MPETPALSPDRRSIADQIVSLFENSTREIQYGYAENLEDGRGITAGRAGFTSGTGDMLEVVERFTAFAPDNDLAAYLPRLRELGAEPSDSTAGLEGLEAAWARYGDDPLFRAVQDAVVDDYYYGPAMDHAADIGASLPLLLLVLYDTIIQHGDGDDPDGLSALIERAADAAGGVPADGVGEQAFLEAFLDVRRADLLNPFDAATREEWAQSVGRVDALRALLEAGNVQLDGPIAISVYGDDFVVDVAEGGADVPVLLGTASANRLEGAEGADALYAGQGADRLFGFAGDDLLEAGDGNDHLAGGLGADTALGGAGDDSLYAGAGDLGDDIFIGGAGDDIVGGGTGADLLAGGGLDDGAAVDVSHHANDALADGRDTLFGGAGADTLLGGGWQDGLVGDDGRFETGEEIVSGTDANILWAGAGADLAFGAAGADRIGGGTGADSLFGAAGRDTLYGSSGADLLDGGAGADILQAGDDADTLLGGAGDDVLYNGTGDDSVDGGTGNDTLWAGAGNDILRGGAGDDRFNIGQTPGSDTITDFTADEDLIDLRNSAAGFADFGAMLAAATDTPAGVSIALGNGETLLLADLSVSALSADDFLI